MLQFVFGPILLTCGLWLSCHHTTASEPELPTVSHVDLNRYMGRWYEIAAFPQFFERGCYGAKADYALNDDNTVEVVNSCNKGSLTGELSTTRGSARVVDETSNAKLKVTFFWPFSGDYWILALDDDYQTAMVGAPNRKYLWFLSRQRSIPQATYDGLVARAKALGFDVTKLRKMPQPT